MHDQRDLQATQQIISLFEVSKDQCEIELEMLPGIYCVIDENGTIYKGNKTLSQHMGCSSEGLLNASFRPFFSDDRWNEFIKEMSLVDVNPEMSNDFELEISTKEKGALFYLWKLRRLESPRKDIPKLFSVIGRDVSEVKRASNNNARLQFELNTAKIVQEAFFPNPKCNFGDATISGFYESASECGGDWWHYSFIGEKLYLWIGDVTGHGVAAGLVVGAINAAVSIFPNEDISTSEALIVLNKAISFSGNAQRAMTFTVVSIDLKTGEGTYSSASHEPVILIPGAMQTYRWNDLKILNSEPTTPLGSPESKNYKEYSFKLEKGDRLFLYSDGLYDVENPSGDRWSRSIFRKKLAEVSSSCRGTDDLVASLQAEISKFRENASLADDVTYFAFQM